MVTIGIISDSHGNEARLRAALGVLTGRGVEVIVHCGDIGSVECMAMLGAARARTYAVLGNGDRDAPAMMDAAQRHGVRLSTEVVVIPDADGRAVVVTHGHDGFILDQLITQGQFAYVLHGHTHRIRDDRLGRTRVINPGALHRAKGGMPTVAILDTEKDKLEYLTLTV